jgi:hypothetical protein
VAKCLLGTSLGAATGLVLQLLHKAHSFISVPERCHLQISVQEKLRTELGVQFGGETLRGETKRTLERTL